MYGNFGTHVLSAAYGNTIVDDELAFRVSVDDQASDGFVTNELRDDDQEAASSITTWRGKLLYEPAALADLSIYTTLSYAEKETGADFVSPTDVTGLSIDPFRRKSFANIQGQSTLDQKAAIVEARYRINDQWDLTSISVWNDSDLSLRDDADSQATGGRASRTREDESTIYTQEVRLAFADNRLKGNLGAYFYDEEQRAVIDDLLAEDVRSSVLNVLPPPLGASVAALYDDPFFLTRQGSRTVDVENWAVFGNMEYGFNEFVTVFAGFRYDDESVRNTADETRRVSSSLPNPLDLGSPLGDFAAIVNGLIEGALGLAPLNSEANYSAFLPKLGLTLNWSDDLATSFTVQRAYRAGGAGTSAVGNYEYDPEYTTNYEFSLRSMWFDNMLTVNANIFFVDWTDQQVQLVEPTIQTDFMITNAGKSELYGAELELSLTPRANIELYGNIGLVETEFTKFPANEELGSSDLSGNEFLHAPNVTAAAGVNWAISSDLKMQVDVDYQHSNYADLENMFLNDSRTLVNTKITYRLSDKLDIALVARNLFDEEYISLNGLGFGTVTYVGQPRTFAVQFQGSF